MGTTVVGGQSDLDYLSAYNHREYALHKFYITTEHIFTCEVPYDGASRVVTVRDRTRYGVVIARVDGDRHRVST